MQIVSKHFDKVEVHKNTVFTFSSPIFGFEDYRDFTIIIDPDVGHDVLWLQSMEESGLCFILANPKSFKSEVEYIFSQQQLSSVGAFVQEDVDVFCILNVGETLKESTINLKSPIIFNPLNNQAVQVIMDQDYPIRERLVV